MCGILALFCRRSNDDNYLDYRMERDKKIYYGIEKRATESVAKMRKLMKRQSPYYHGEYLLPVNGFIDCLYSISKEASSSNNTILRNRYPKLTKELASYQGQMDELVLRMEATELSCFAYYCMLLEDSRQRRKQKNERRRRQRENPYLVH